MKNDFELISEILKPRVDRILLRGFYYAIFDETKTKFFAFTFSEINKKLYDDIGFLLDKLSESAYYTNEEKTREYITSDSWHAKSTEKCIEEGIYQSYSLRFTGMLYENEWYIQTELIYFGETISVEQAKKISMLDNKIDEQWNAFRFVSYKPTLLNGEKIRNVDLEEFEHVPWLVANIKQQRKLKINRAFAHYINVEVFIPFVEKIKIKYPDDYVSCIPLYIDDYTLIFPQHKKFVIAVIMVANNKDEYRIKYFLYSFEKFKMYEWIYFQPEIYGHEFHYSLEVIKVLSRISDWNDYYFLIGSRTMDDDNFWNNYVFKKGNNEYLYLKEMNL